MRKEQKMDASARKFLARRKLSPSFFEQKLPKRTPTLKLKITESWLENLAKHIALAITHAPSDFLKIGALFSQIIPVVSQTYNGNFYFSTPAGGKNVLMTNQSSAQIEEILTTCNTNNLNSAPVIRKILTLCEGSVIQALSGSPALNATTDPALRCISDEFDTQWCSDSSSCGTVCIISVTAAILIPLAILYCCCKWLCCPSYKPPAEYIEIIDEPPSRDPHIRRQQQAQKAQLRLLAEQNRFMVEERNRRDGDRMHLAIRSMCTIS